MLVTVGFALFIMGIFLAFGNQIVGMFVDEPEVIEIGGQGAEAFLPVLRGARNYPHHPRTAQRRRRCRLRDDKRLRGGRRPYRIRDNPRSYPGNGLVGSLDHYLPYLGDNRADVTYPLLAGQVEG